MEAENHKEWLVRSANYFRTLREQFFTEDARKRSRTLLILSILVIALTQGLMTVNTKQIDVFGLLFATEKAWIIISFLGISALYLIVVQIVEITNDVRQWRLKVLILNLSPESPVRELEKVARENGTLLDAVLAGIESDRELRKAKHAELRLDDPLKRTSLEGRTLDEMEEIIEEENESDRERRKRYEEYYDFCKTLSTGADERVKELNDRMQITTEMSTLFGVQFSRVRILFYFRVGEMIAGCLLGIFAVFSYLYYVVPMIRG